jgi:hypothetical protein
MAERRLYERVCIFVGDVGNRDAFRIFRVVHVVKQLVRNWIRTSLLNRE